MIKSESKLGLTNLLCVQGKSRRRVALLLGFTKPCRIEGKQEGFLKTESPPWFLVNQVSIQEKGGWTLHTRKRLKTTFRLCDGCERSLVCIGVKEVPGVYRREERSLTYKEETGPSLIQEELSKIIYEANPSCISRERSVMYKQEKVRHV